MSNTAKKIFTSGTTNWTAPAGVYQILVQGCGGGGGGAGSVDGKVALNKLNWGGGGGACSPLVTRIMPVTPGNIYAITVGAGGAGGAGGNAGGLGGDTTIIDGDDYVWFNAPGACGGYNCSLNNYPDGYCGGVVYGGTPAHNSAPVTKPSQTSDIVERIGAAQPVYLTYLVLSDLDAVKQVVPLNTPIVPLYAGGFGGCSNASDPQIGAATSAKDGSNYIAEFNYDNGGIHFLGGVGGTVGARSGSSPTYTYGGGGGGGGAASAFGSGATGGNGGASSGSAGAAGQAGYSAAADAYGAGGGGAGAGGYGSASYGAGAAGGTGAGGICIISWNE